MLTEEASRERRWGRFPALRQALETQRLPVEYSGLTSVSDTLVDTLRRSLETAILVGVHKTDIIETARAVGQDRMYEDLRRLEAELNAAAQEVTRAIDEVRATYRLL